MESSIATYPDNVPHGASTKHADSNAVQRRGFPYLDAVLPKVFPYLDVEEVLGLRAP